MTYVTDTCFLIDVAQGNEAARALLRDIRAAGEGLIVPTVAVAEYLTGSADPVEDLDTLGQAGEITDLTVADAHAAALLAKETFAAGRFPGWSDILLAGVAHARGLSVVTRSTRHFEGVRTRTYGP